jgi:hypothetical protein
MPEIAKLEKTIKARNRFRKRNKMIDTITEKIPSPIIVMVIKNTFRNFEWYGFNKINPFAFE